MSQSKIFRRLLARHPSRRRRRPFGTVELRNFLSPRYAIYRCIGVRLSGLCVFIRSVAMCVPFVQLLGVPICQLPTTCGRYAVETRRKSGADRRIRNGEWLASTIGGKVQSGTVHRVSISETNTTDVMHDGSGHFVCVCVCVCVCACVRACCRRVRRCDNSHFLPLREYTWCFEIDFKFPQ